MNGGCRWNPGLACRSTWGSSARSTYITGLMFVQELELSAFRFERHRVIHLASES